MDFASEITALKTITEALQTLEPEARQRVLDYVGTAFGVRPGDIGRSVQRAAPPSLMPMKAGQDHKPASPQEYLRRFSYKTMTKRIGVIAVFLERERQRQRFTLKDITEAFRDAKEPKTPAHSQYARAVAMNYLAKDGDSYYATSAAESLVDSYDSGAAASDSDD